MKRVNVTTSNKGADSSLPLREIPGVGRVIANELYQLGIRTPSDLRGSDPETLYDLHNQRKGSEQDRCVLYVFRCAVYYADTIGHRRDPEKLKWWNWKDEKR